MPTLSIRRPNLLLLAIAAFVLAFLVMIWTAHPAAASSLGLSSTAQDMSSVMGDLTTSTGGSGTSSTALPSWFNWHNFISVCLFTIVPLAAIYGVIQVLHSMAEARTPGQTVWAFIQVGGILVVATICILFPLKLMSYQQSQGAILAITSIVK